MKPSKTELDHPKNPEWRTDNSDRDRFRDKSSGPSESVSDESRDGWLARDTAWPCVTWRRGG